MSKLKKLAKITKTGIKDPKKLVKGARYLKKHGYAGFKERLKAVSNISNNDVDSETRFEELVMAYANKKFSIIIGQLTGDIEQIIKKQNYPNVEICKNTEEAIGEYLVFLGRNETLKENACFEYAKIAYKYDSDIIYSDNEVSGEANGNIGYKGKPQWSPHLILSCFYVGNTFAMKKSLFEEIGGFSNSDCICKKFDLFLRASEKTSKIMRTDEAAYVAYHSSIPSDEDSDKQFQALKQHIDRVYPSGTAEIVKTDNNGIFKTKFCCNDALKVSIIIPIKDNVGYLKKLLNSIFDKTTYKNYEIIILDNNSEKQETFDFFEEIKNDSRISIIPAKMEFNWSKINNYGTQFASGDVYIFMNNDMEIITPTWIEELVSYSIREEVGLVGAKLLFEDGTIQHAGVVIGMNGWADHLYKECPRDLQEACFVPPIVTRNVMAVTGACIAIEKRKFEEIGRFSEDFIICGSDIELGIRAFEKGYVNVYNSDVEIYHYESKSRDSFIPEIDFEMSEKAYSKYRGNDFFYSKALTSYNTIPAVRKEKEYVKINRGVSATEYDIGEITPYTFRISNQPRKRLNLLVPTVNSEYVFGGIATAIKFFNILCEKTGYDKRIISTDSLVNSREIERYSNEYKYVECEEDSLERNQLLSFSNRTGRSLPVSQNDYFIATAWWTAYCTQNAYKDLMDLVGYEPNPIVYLVQDYEPGFYPWSTRFMLSESTYKSEMKQIAVFNSSILKQFMNEKGYSFFKEYVLEPVFNDELKEKFEELKGTTVKKKKQILLYGRPGVARNAMELIVHSLKEWMSIQEGVENWEIISAGEKFEEFEIGNDIKIKSLGKLTLDEYAQILIESYAGLSFMVSPHPSYPPLEMATFSIKVITNTYANKDLSDFNSNIISLNDASPRNIAKALKNICDNYEENVLIESKNAAYENSENVFGFLDILKNDL